MTVAARHVCVTGRVQGVFFRAWTRDQARELGIGGWVRNCADGSVEAHIEGDDAAIETLISRLHHGPRSAQVDDVRVTDGFLQNFETFEVRH
jgi:acylphosphatase